ncbi:chemoreceptor glutamine deamidase CheD [Robbsia sp. KACC 23696]|uniref:chemoreceptor glutamine deamidase CheD n=1 Tax=Robbsia sp. KACC 23696 TaxID=3149231 RepID=UPI00325C2B92
MSALPQANHFYQDMDFGKPGVKLLMNEFFVTSDDMVLTTVLGSCVSACIRDPYSGLGGMNHFMLPDGGGDPSRALSDAMRYGSFLMEVLINELIKRGARRASLEAKVFGGAAVLKRMHTLNIGDDNSRFVRRYLALEGIRIVAEDLQGEHPRKVAYMPTSGRAMVRKLPLDVRVTDPVSRTAEIELAQREKAMAEEMGAMRDRHARRAPETMQLFGAAARGTAPRPAAATSGVTSTKTAAVAGATATASAVTSGAAPAPKSRVELFIRRPAPATPPASPTTKTITETM